MEKYAVDLDKVLDELEFNEDRAEQLASAVNKRTANGGTPHIGYGPGTRKSSAPSMHYRRPAFEPINLADADFAAAPQPSASYVESSYTPQAITHHENRPSGLHWQQNGVAVPHISSMFSGLSEFVSDNKNDSKSHPPSHWIQKNMTESRNASKGKSEKRSGSLDVFISNVTLNSGGHVSECNTTDRLYYNEINKLGETIGDSNISHKQDKTNTMDSGVLGSSVYEKFLSNSVTKNEIISGLPSIVSEHYSVGTDGLECQTSESSVMGVEISCEAEGLGCNSSNPCKEQSSEKCTRVTETNNSEDQVVDFNKNPDSCDNEGTRDPNCDGNLPTNKTDKVIHKEMLESSNNTVVVSGLDGLTSISVAENLPEINTEIQNKAVMPVVGFTSFTDVSDEELQQYLQELEEEVRNETRSLAVGYVAGQESITGEGSVNVACSISTACEGADHGSGLDSRKDHPEGVGNIEEKISSDNRNVSRTEQIQEYSSEVTRPGDSPRTLISDMNMMPADTGPPLSTVLAAAPGSNLPLLISLPPETPGISQDTIPGAASQESGSALPQSTVPLPNTTTPSCLHPVAKCDDVSCKETNKNYVCTPVVSGSDDINLTSSGNNLPTDVAPSNSASAEVASLKSVPGHVPPSEPALANVSSLLPASTNVSLSQSSLADVVSRKPASVDVGTSKSAVVDVVSTESVLSSDISSKSVLASGVLPLEAVSVDVASSKPASANVAPVKPVSAYVALPKPVSADVSSKPDLTNVGSSKPLLAKVSSPKPVSANVAHSEFELANGAISKPLSSGVDCVSASTDVSAALAQYVSSNTDVNANEGRTASYSSSTSSRLVIPDTTVTHQDSQLPQSTKAVPQYSSPSPVCDPVSSIPNTIPNVSTSEVSVSSTNKPSSSTSDTGLSGLQQVQDSQPGHEDSSQTDSTLMNHCGPGEVERTLEDSKAELLLEAVAGSPPSYQSVIDASNYECLGDGDKYVSPEHNPFPRSQVGVCTAGTPEEASSIDVVGEEERPSRPHFLHLPSKINLDGQNVVSASSESPPTMLTYGPPGETPSATPHLSMSDNLGSEGTISSPDLSDTSSVEQVPSDSLSDVMSPEDRTLGKLPPYWVPDADAPSCMLCDLKFTLMKRRHHCRACGKVLCAKCCNLKSRLEYLDNAEARVCQPCFEVLARVEQCESVSGSPTSVQEPGAGINPILGRRPNPNNPMEYCSTIPPLEQAASTLRQPPPSVLVPVGVLKREGSARSKSDVAKQVMFSDGIRPGGDLTELDGSSEPRLPYRRPGRVLKRVGTPPGVLPIAPPSHSALYKALPIMDPKTSSFIPEKGMPPVVTLLNGDARYEEDYESTDTLMTVLKSETELPVMFAINRNFFVQVKILNLDCCVNRTCWCFSTLGLRCVGQDEVLVVLECQPGEATVPRDMFLHFNTLYQEASRGSTVGEMGYNVVQRSNFLGSLDHGGFLYVRPTFQCLHKLVLPPAPYLVGILIHRWETPWARLFPIRLMLRLGAEFRYYPCMLVSIRQRKPVYCEIGHTIMNLLADFRNLSYTLPSVRGLVIHMEDRQTSILLPKNRYDQVMRALNNSNDHVLAFAANFSLQADSHLVCIQGTEDENYHTQAINIHTKPRKVTGASFVVFNGALKSSLNLTAKSSIVEDGLMVQITADDMVALRTSLRNMGDFTIGCGPSGAPAPDELVLIKWVVDDKNFNVGVQSCIDGKCLDGVPSIRVHNGTDYVGSSRFIRWTEVFIIESGDGSGQSGDPLDISRLSESIAQATCLALVQHLDALAQAGLAMLSVRADIHPDNVGYEAGSGGERLPPIYMNSLDNELVSVLHKAASSASDSPAAVLELVFHVMQQ